MESGWLKVAREGGTVAELEEARRKHAEAARQAALLEFDRLCFDREYPGMMDALHAAMLAGSPIAENIYKSARAGVRLSPRQLHWAKVLAGLAS